MEHGVAMSLLWPLSDILQCLQLLLQAGALLFQDQEAQTTLDSLTREAMASLWYPHPRVERPLWRLDTSTDWWDRLVLGQWDDQQWLRNFRMRKQTFLELCAWLTPALQRATTRLRAPIPIKKRVAIAVWKLATSDSYRSVAHQFGVGRSTVGAVVMEVVHAINDVLLPRVIRLRNVDATLAGFAALGFPNCGGALDTTHIPFRAPEHRAAHFMNRKGYCSIVLQALVDHRGRFLDIYVGWSGRAHDSRILRNSGLFRRLEAGTYFPQRELTVGDVPMPICVIGDGAYPLLPWLMRPYTGQPDQNRARFNDHLNRAHNQVELAFGRLKARFQCLLTRLEMGEQNATEVLAACCVLHNIVERSREAFLPAWMAAEGQAYEQPHTAASGQAHQDGVRIREALTDMFSQAPQ